MGTICCGSNLPLVRVAGERLGGHAFIFDISVWMPASGAVASREQCAVAVCLDRQSSEQHVASLRWFGLEFRRRDKDRNSACHSSRRNSICGPSTSYSLRFTMVQTVCCPVGHRLAKTP